MAGFRQSRQLAVTPSPLLRLVPLSLQAQGGSEVRVRYRGADRTLVGSRSVEFAIIAAVIIVIFLFLRSPDGGAPQEGGAPLGSSPAQQPDTLEEAKPQRPSDSPYSPDRVGAARRAPTGSSLRDMLPRGLGGTARWGRHRGRHHPYAAVIPRKLKPREVEYFDSVARTATEHIEVLIRKYRQSVRRDEYGILVGRDDKWFAEREYFVLNVCPHQQAAWGYSEGELLRLEAAMVVDLVVQEALVGAPAEKFHEDMTPVEFEAFCASELEQNGWKTHVTRLAGDQGVDVVATKGGTRVVLQCKLYSQPVGNKAVQEVFAGKEHEGADFACVVTNVGYTGSARQLAASTGVRLLHWTDLKDLEKHLSEEERR
jgi:restriction system protein